MKTIVNNWNLFRAIRLLLGIAVIVKGATDGKSLFGIAGGFVALMALFNIGCCGGDGCAVPGPSGNTSSTKNKKHYL